MIIDWDIVVPILGLLVQLIIAGFTYFGVRKQIINSGVTQFRQQWIDNFRNTLSEFIAAANIVVVHLSKVTKYDDIYQDYIRELLQKKYKLFLLLKDKDTSHGKERLDHQEVIKNINIISSLMEKITSYSALAENKDNLIIAWDETVKSARVVILEEWEQVKKGKK